jgi:hypothetical protein
VAHSAIWELLGWLLQAKIPVSLPVWCKTTMVPGAPIVWSTVRVRIASITLPPAFRTIVAPIYEIRGLLRTYFLYLNKVCGDHKALTKLRIDAKYLIRVQSRVRAWDHNDAGPTSSQYRSHLHERNWLLISGCIRRISCQHFFERSCNHLEFGDGVEKRD